MVCRAPLKTGDLGSLLKYLFFYYYHYYQKYIVRQSLTLVQLVEIVNAILLWIWHGNSNGRIIYLETTLYIKVYLRFFFDNYFVVFFFVRPFYGAPCKGEAREYKICNTQVRENVNCLQLFILTRLRATNLIWSDLVRASWDARQETAYNDTYTYVNALRKQNNNINNKGNNLCLNLSTFVFF